MPETRSPLNKIEEARARLAQQATVTSRVEAEVQAAQIPRPRVAVSKGGTIAMIVVAAVFTLAVSWYIYGHFRYYFPSSTAFRPKSTVAEREEQLKKSIAERTRRQKPRPTPAARRPSSSPTPAPPPKG